MSSPHTSDETPAPRHSILRQAGLTSVGAGLSIASGLLLDVALAATLGAGVSSDAFFVAARVPLGIVVVALSVTTQAFVPQIALWTHELDRRRSNAHSWELLVRVTALGLLVAGAGALVAEPLVRITAPGLSEGTAAAAVPAARVLFAIVPLGLAAEVLRAYLNARHRSSITAAMNVAMNSTTALIIIATDPGAPGAAVAFLVGASCQLALVAYLAWREGLRPRRVTLRADAATSEATALARRPLASAGVNAGTRVVEQAIVSFLPSGSISILNYAYRLISAVGGTVFFRSVIVTVLPRLTKAHADGDRAHFDRAARQALEITILVAIPLTMFVALLADPTVNVLFHRGSFTEDDARLLGLTLTVYAASLVGSGVQRVFLAMFFARLDTKTPLHNTFYGAVVNVLLVAALVLIVGESEDAVLAVAAAFSISQYFIAWHAWRRVHTQLGTRFTGIGPEIAWNAAATLAAGLAMAALGLALGIWAPDRTGARELVEVALVAGIGAVVLGIALCVVPGPIREAMLRRCRS